MRASLLFALLLLPFAVHAEDAKPATITVYGEATARVMPDQVTLPVTVREENSNLKLAKQHADDKLRALLKLAADTGIAKDKIQTTQTSVNPQYDYPKDSTKPHLRGYQVETSIDFKLTNMSKLSDFMNGVIALDISTIGNVSYSLQEEDKIKQDTLNTALEHARSKAERLAATAKVTLGKVLAIEEGVAEIHPPRPMMRMAAFGGVPGNAASSPDLPSGLIEIRQSVTATYSIQ